MPEYQEGDVVTYDYDGTIYVGTVIFAEKDRVQFLSGNEYLVTTPDDVRLHKQEELEL